MLGHKIKVLLNLLLVIAIAGAPTTPVWSAGFDKPQTQALQQQGFQPSLPMLTIKESFVNPTTGRTVEREVFYITTDTQAEYMAAQSWLKEQFQLANKHGQPADLTLINVAADAEAAREQSQQSPMNTTAESWGLHHQNFSKTAFVLSYFAAVKEWVEFAAADIRQATTQVALDIANDAKEKSELRRKQAVKKTMNVFQRFYKGLINALYKNNITVHSPISISPTHSEPVQPKVSVPLYKATFAAVRGAGVGAAVGYAMTAFVANANLDVETALVAGSAVWNTAIAGGGFSLVIQLFGTQYLNWFNLRGPIADWSAKLADVVVRKPMLGLSQFFFKNKKEKIAELDKKIVGSQYMKELYGFVNSNTKYAETELIPLAFPILLFTAAGVSLYPNAVTHDWYGATPPAFWAPLFEQLTQLTGIDGLYGLSMHILEAEWHVARSLGVSMVGAWVSQGLFDVATSKILQAKITEVSQKLAAKEISADEALEQNESLDFKANAAIFAISILSNFAVVLGVPDIEVNRAISHQIIEVMGWTAGTLTVYSYLAYNKTFMKMLSAYIWDFEKLLKKVFLGFDYADGRTIDGNARPTHYDYSSCASLLKRKMLPGTTQN